MHPDTHPGTANGYVGRLEGEGGRNEWSVYEGSPSATQTEQDRQEAVCSYIQQGAIEYPCLHANEVQYARNALRDVEALRNG